MTKYKVVLIPFPFDDLSSSKVRPAVCLSDPIGPFEHIILAFFSSRKPAETLASDLTIDTSHPDFSHTGLRVSSTIQLHRLMTVARALIQRELGTLSQAMQIEIKQRLRELLGL